MKHRVLKDHLNIRQKLYEDNRATKEGVIHMMEF